MTYGRVVAVSGSTAAVALNFTSAGASSRRGGAAVFGRGLLTVAGKTSIIDDCKVELLQGAITVSGGGFTATDMCTAARAIFVFLTQTPTDKQLSFRPASGMKALLQVNAFGFVTDAHGQSSDGHVLDCPK